MPNFLFSTIDPSGLLYIVGIIVILFSLVRYTICTLHELWVGRNDEYYEILSQYTDTISETKDKDLRKKLLRVYFSNRLYKKQAEDAYQRHLKVLKRYQDFRERAYPYEKAIFSAYVRYAKIGTDVKWTCEESLFNEAIIQSLNQFHLENPIEKLKLLREIDVITKENKLGNTLTSYGKCLHNDDMDFNDYVKEQIKNHNGFKIGWKSLKSFCFSEIYNKEKDNVIELVSKYESSNSSETYRFKDFMGSYHISSLFCHTISYGQKGDMMYIKTSKDSSQNEIVYTKETRSSLVDVYKYLYEIQLTHHVEKENDYYIIKSNL